MVSSGGFAGIAASPAGESIFTADESFFVSRFWLGDGGGLTLGPRTQIGTSPKAIVVRDSRSGRPSDLQLGRTRRNQSRGTARLTATAGRSGRLKLAGKGVERVRKHVRGGRSAALTIRPRRWKLHELGRQGWVDVQVTVELDPKRGEPTRRSRDVRLLLGRRLSLPGAEFAQRRRMSRLSRAAVGPRRSSPSATRSVGDQPSPFRGSSSSLRSRIRRSFPPSAPRSFLVSLMIAF